MKTGKELYESFTDVCKGDKTCPICDEDISTTALTKLVYAFKPCACDLVDYVHLRPTIYHRECFGGIPTAEPLTHGKG